MEETIEYVADTLEDVEARVKRIESRIVQMMLHVGCKPEGLKDPVYRPQLQRKERINETAAP